MKKSLISLFVVSVVILLAGDASAAPTADLDLTQATEGGIPCLFVEKYDLIGGCDESDLAGGNCSLNYTSRFDEEASIFEADWIQSSIASVELTDVCATLNTGVISAADYSQQVVVTLNGEDGNPASYFLYNVANDSTRAAYTVTSAYDLISNGPTNFKKAQFGKGFAHWRVALAQGATTGQPLVYQSMDLIALDSSANLPTGTCPNVAISGEYVLRNCLDVGLGFNSDFFLNRFKYTPGLWTYAFQMIFFFIFTLGAKQIEPINQKFKDSKMTYHPWVSVRNTGHPAFTKTSRYTQIFLAIATWSFVHTLFLMMYHPVVGAVEAYNPVNHLVLPLVIGLVASWVLTHITGSILMNTMNMHRQYAYSYKACKSMNEKIELEDKYEGQKAYRYFAFYVLSVIIFQVLCWETIWQQEYFSTEFKYYYWMNLAISGAVEWIVVDWLRVLIGSGDGSGLGACLRRRGFYYDYSLHDLFEQIENDDE